jgi:very-short-patch-repair endonuclease
VLKAKLILELDGGGHYEPEQMKKDDERTEALQSMKLQVLRISNIDIERSFAGVCEKIDHIVRASLPQSAPPTAPSSAGALRKPNIITNNKQSAQ